MTSEERREARYQRRKKTRAEKAYKKAFYARDFSALYSFENLWRSYLNCRKNVAWKGSVQRYIFDAPIRTARVHKKLLEGKYKCATPNEWDTYERGKLRHIKSVPIGERVVQRCLADNVLVPILTPTFIYDNGACMKYKGYDFAMRRLHKHLMEYYKRHGNEGYVLLFDFTKFYENVDHDLLMEVLRKKISDSKVLDMVNKILLTFGDNGLGLGSQISQILALLSADRLDHFCKQDLHIKAYGRYNDDGYLIHESKAYLQECLAKMKVLCEELKIKLNLKKTHIVKLSHGFKFLKARIFLTASGKIVKKISKRSIVVERRKLKKLKVKLHNGIIDYKHIEMQYQSWRAYAKKFDAYHTISNMDKLYKELYIDDKEVKAA